MYCYQCGSIIESERFCRDCGAEAFALTTSQRNGWPVVTGYFAVGVITFLIVFFLLIALGSILLPTGGPQMAILVLLLLGAVAAGLFSASMARRTIPTVSTREMAPHGLTSPASRLSLSEGHAFDTLDSVTTETTRKLRVPG
jgi:hypothetical protein